MSGDEVARRYAEIAARRDDAVTAAMARWSASQAGTDAAAEAIDVRARAALTPPPGSRADQLRDARRVDPALDELDANEQVSSWLR